VEKLTVLETKIDKVQEDISEIKITMAVNTASLEQHMELSRLNEEALNVLKTELKPIHEHVLKVNFVITILGALTVTAGAVYTVMQIAQSFIR
jgi:hypothetical protein